MKKVKMICSIAIFAAITLTTQIAKAQCPPTPILAGTHTLCLHQGTYHITNYSGIPSDYTVTTNCGGCVVSSISGPVNNGVFTVNFASTTIGVTVTVSLTGTCTGVATIDVMPCCDDGTGNNVYDGTQQDIPGIIFSGSYFATNLTFTVHGWLTIDVTTEFRNCTILMAEGARINVVNAGTQYVQLGTVVKAGCNNLWETIFINDGCWFKVREYLGVPSKIEDAQYGLTGKGNVTGDFTDMVEFQKNYVSIYLPSNTSGNTWTLTPAVLNQSFLIDGVAGMLEHYYNQIPTTLVGYRPYAGMVINDCNNFSTDQNGLYTTGNFRNLNSGILSYKSNTTIRFCEFYNIAPAFTGNSLTYQSGNNFNGSGIYASAANSSNPKTLIVGGTTANKCNFDGCKRGIYTLDYMNTDIRENNLQNIYYPYGLGNTITAGIEINHSPGKTIAIFNNHFTNFFMGMRIYNNSYATLNIEGNILNSGTYITSADMFSNTAIYCWNSLVGSRDPMHGRIYENETYNTRIGIYTNGYIGDGTPTTFNINFNKIHQDKTYAEMSNSGKNHYGIWCDYPLSIDIIDNGIERIHPVSSSGTIPASFESLLQGIVAKQPSATYIGNNHISHCGSCIRVQDNAIGSLIYCNQMYDGYWGINFTNVNNLPDHVDMDTPQDNSWWNWGTGTNIYRMSGTNIGSQIQWYYRTLFAGPEHDPWPINISLNVFPFPANVTDKCAYVPDEQFRNNNIENIADGSAFTSNANAQYKTEEYGYNAFKDDAVLLNSNATNLLFVSNKETGNSDEWRDVRTDIENENYFLALSKTNAITPQNHLEENWKKINQIDLAQKISGDETLTQQQFDDLTSIAYETTWEGGEAVFYVRGKLQIEVDDMVNGLRITNQLTLNNGAPQNLILNNFKEENIVEIKNNIPNERYSIIVYDTTGKKVKSVSSVKLIDTSNLPCGIYMVKLNAENYFARGKFVIVR